MPPNPVSPGELQPLRCEKHEDSTDSLAVHDCPDCEQDWDCVPQVDDRHAEGPDFVIRVCEHGRQATYIPGCEAFVHTLTDEGEGATICKARLRVVAVVPASHLEAAEARRDELQEALDDLDAYYHIQYEAGAKREIDNLEARAERAEEALDKLRVAVRLLQRRYERREQLHTSDFTAALHPSQPKGPKA